jgi:hypothetical protein
MMALPAFSDFADGVGGDEDQQEDSNKSSYFVVYSTRKEELRFCVNGFLPGDMAAYKGAILEAIADVKRAIVKGKLAEMEEGGGGGSEAVQAAPESQLDFKKIMAKAMKDKEIAKVGWAALPL